MNTVRYHLGDIRDVQAAMPDESVDMFCTSPPFLALRSYLPADHPDKHREIGSEPTPAEFLDTLLELTAEWRRLLAPTGSIAVELGDTYAGSTSKGGPGIFGTGSHFETREDTYDNRRSPDGWPLAKSLCLIPSAYAFALAYGINPMTGQPSPAGRWRVRNLIVWHRPNPPVGALRDKCRPSTSYVTVACTSDRRWFDLDAERNMTDRHERAVITNGELRHGGFGHDPARNHNHGRDEHANSGNPAGAPPLDAWFDDTPAQNASADASSADVWTIPTQPYAGAHYATFPVTLPRKLINLMCPRQVCRVCGEARRRLVEDNPELAEAKRLVGDKWQSGGLERGLKRPNGVDRIDVSGHKLTLGWSDCGHDNYRPGIVCDPFAGTGTTALAAAQLGRDAVLIDIDPRNIPLARHRIGDHCAILAEQSDGPVTTWTVNHQLPGLKGEAEGQLNLFAL